MKLIISEKELVARTNLGRPSLCKICYDSKKKIVMIDFDTIRKKEIIWGMCDECKKIMTQCEPCKKPKT